VVNNQRIIMKKFLITANNTIKEALTKLQVTGYKCLIVRNEKNQLLGTLSDGDVRKALIKNKPIFTKIKDLYQKKPMFIFEHNFSSTYKKNLFSKNDYGLIPIVDKKYFIKNIICKDKLLKKKIKIDVPAVIMAGGKGTRLRPFTNVLPKPLIPINGKPVIDIIIENFKNFGVKEIYLSINYKSKILESYFKESKTKIKYLKEKIALGTAGILNNLRNSKKEFFVTNCDTILDINYNELYEFHKKNKHDFTIVVTSKKFKVPYGVCKLDNEGNFEKIDEKPKNDLLISVGLYLINSKIFKQISKNKYIDMNSLIDLSLNHNFKVGVFQVNNSSWKDVGKWEDFRKIKHY